MPFFLQIVDDNGNPDPIETIADLLVENLLQHRVGLFKTKSQVEKALREAVHDLLRARTVIQKQPLVTETCQHCSKQVGVWHNFPDGSIRCTECKKL